MENDITPPSFKYVVYFIFHPASQGWYVGSTSNFHTRQTLHLSQLRLHKHHSKLFQKLYDEHEDKTLVWVEIPVETREWGYELEQRELDRLHAQGHLVLNVATDARVFGKGAKRTPEHIAIISRTHKGKTISQDEIERSKRAKMEADGVTFRKDIRQAMSEGWRSKAKAVMIDGVRYRSIADAAEALDLPFNIVQNRVWHNYTKGKYVNWKFADD